jgi:hypothetical protein
MRRPQSRRGGAGESMRDQGNASLLVEAGQARSMEIGRRGETRAAVGTEGAACPDAPEKRGHVFRQKIRFDTKMI